jgi:hypothetical protein
MPWNAGPWKAGAGAPTVAYPYVIAENQNPESAAPIQDWAMTGSTPADWDPKVRSAFGQAGRFANRLKAIKNSVVVMTLGANPLLNDYLKISGIQNGRCAETVRKVGLKWFALDPGPAVPASDSVLDCYNRQWAANKQDLHLQAIYNTLLKDGNKVVVLGYPMTCPWSFGNWQPAANLFSGPDQGNSCREEKHPNIVNPTVQVTQWQQAVALGRQLNFSIAKDVKAVRVPGSISFVEQSTEWENHQAWNAESWIFKNDTWIHPSKEGHRQLAESVTNEMCRLYKHWCGGAPVKWTP